MLRLRLILCVMEAGLNATAETDTMCDGSRAECYG